MLIVCLTGSRGGTRGCPQSSRHALSAGPVVGSGNVISSIGARKMSGLVQIEDVNLCSEKGLGGGSTDL